MPAGAVNKGKLKQLRLHSCYASVSPGKPTKRSSTDLDLEFEKIKEKHVKSPIGNDSIGIMEHNVGANRKRSFSNSRPISSTTGDLLGYFSPNRSNKTKKTRNSNKDDTDVFPKTQDDQEIKNTDTPMSVPCVTLDSDVNRKACNIFLPPNLDTARIECSLEHEKNEFNVKDKCDASDAATSIPALSHIKMMTNDYHTNIFDLLKMKKTTPNFFYKKIGYKVNYLDRIVSKPQRMYKLKDIYAQTTRSAIPYSCKYSKGTSAGLGKYALGDDLGKITVIDTFYDGRQRGIQPRPHDQRQRREVGYTSGGLANGEEVEGSQIKVSSNFSAHSNSIFDLLWTQDDTQLLTCSADETILLYDIETSQPLSIFLGHSSSIRRLADHPYEPDIFASGCRDGCIKLWDMRCNAKLVKVNDSDHLDILEYTKPIQNIYAAHVLSTLLSSDIHSSPDSSYFKTARSSVFSAGTTSPSRRYTRKPSSRLGRKAMESLLQNSPSITGLKFLNNGTTLCSAGSADGTLNFWDIRKYSGLIMTTLPGPNFSSGANYNSNSCTRSLIGYTSFFPGMRSRGISSVALSNYNPSVIYACSRDNRIYGYDINTLGSPITCLESPEFKCNSLFVGMSIDKESRYLASGSSNGYTHLWDLKEIERKRNNLKKSHTSNTTGQSTLSNFEGDSCLKVASADAYLLPNTVDSSTSQTYETSAVDWCPWDVNNDIINQLIVCCDDSTVRIWETVPANNTIDSRLINYGTLYRI